LAEKVRDVMLSCESNNGSITSVYEKLTGSGGWTDGRTDGPPNLLTGSDLLAFNTVCVQLAAIMRGTLANDAAKIAACNDVAAQMAIVSKACVRGV
jgi:hypothetical protein